MGRSEFASRFTTTGARMAYALAVALLICTSSAHAQVIEEGGFPVKGSSVSGEFFSLSCPPRLVAQAGESISLSCAAAGVSEEGVRYRWEAVSGGDLRLLSDAQVLAPLFTASLSGSREYTYRSTAMASGVYQAATVTVSVEGTEAGSRLTRTDTLHTTFKVPDVTIHNKNQQTEDFTYTVTLSAPGIDDVTETVTITMQESQIICWITDTSKLQLYYEIEVDEGGSEIGGSEVSVRVRAKTRTIVDNCVYPPGELFEGGDDFQLGCTARGSANTYSYVWTGRGSTVVPGRLSSATIARPMFDVPGEVAANETYEYTLTVSAEGAHDAAANVTVLDKKPLDVARATDIESPIFYVPDEVIVTTTYEYLLTVSAENAEDGSAEVAVTVLNRIPAPDPVSPPAEESPVDTSPPLASSSPARTPSDPSAPGVTISASPLRFGVQSSDTEVSLDPVTDGISTYHLGTVPCRPHDAFAGWRRTA